MASIKAVRGQYERQHIERYQKFVPFVNGPKGLICPVFRPIPKPTYLQVIPIAYEDTITINQSVSLVNKKDIQTPSHQAVLPPMITLAYNAGVMAMENHRIYQDIQDFILHPVDKGFEPLALRLFAFQFEQNRPYHRYCEAREKTPDKVASWREIPAVPTAAFKELDLACGPPEVVFLTSGTSQGPGKRGRHLIPCLDLHRAAILSNFSAHLLPDLDRLRAIRILILAGSPYTMPHSSLSHMMEIVRKEYGSPDSAYYLNECGLEILKLQRDLDRACEKNRPVMLLGITLAFHQFMEHCRKGSIRFRLPPGSRLMDTGGFKGRKIRLSKGTLYSHYGEILGIPPSHIVNEYGMTEMASQFYDNVLADQYGQGNREILNGKERYKRVPPWIRTLVLDPETLEELPHGSTGILRHFDLANAGSVMALQTEDLGRVMGKGFEITGRAEGAETRGCALMVEDLLRAP